MYILHISYICIFSSHVFEIYTRSRVKWKMRMSERVRIQIHKCIPANKSCPATILRGHLIPLLTDCVPWQQHFVSFHWLCTLTTAQCVISLIVHLNNSTLRHFIIVLRARGMSVNDKTSHPLLNPLCSFTRAHYLIPPLFREPKTCQLKWQEQKRLDTAVNWLCFITTHYLIPPPSQ